MGDEESGHRFTHTWSDRNLLTKLEKKKGGAYRGNDRGLKIRTGSKIKTVVKEEAFPNIFGGANKRKSAIGVPSFWSTQITLPATHVGNASSRQGRKASGEGREGEQERGGAGGVK